MPLEHLWQRIREGLLPTRHEDGFTFVDMAPQGPTLTRPTTPPHLRPPTFTTTREGESEDVLPQPQVESASEPEEGFEDDTASKELGDWRAARKQAGRLRVPPPRRQPVTG
jgi:hypothetical protein